MDFRCRIPSHRSQIKRKSMYLSGVEPNNYVTVWVAGKKMPVFCFGSYPDTEDEPKQCTQCTTVMYPGGA